MKAKLTLFERLSRLRKDRGLAKQIGLNISSLEQDELEALMKAIKKSELYRQRKGKNASSKYNKGL